MAVRPLHAFNLAHYHLQDDLFDDDDQYDQYDYHNEGDTPQCFLQLPGDKKLFIDNRVSLTFINSWVGS